MRLNSDDKKRKFQTRKINKRVERMANTMKLQINPPRHMFVNKLKRLFSDEEEPGAGQPLKRLDDEPSPGTGDSLERAGDPIIDCS